MALTHTLEIVSQSIIKNLSNVESPGLLNGKTGILIYLCHLSRYSEEVLYQEQARFLLEDIYYQLGTKSISPGFGYGLAGIAWGIEHLVQNGFFEANTDEVLNEIDDKVFYHLTNWEGQLLDLQNGLLGYGFYLVSRLKNKNLVNPLGRDFLLKRLLIELINQLYAIIEMKEELLVEPTTFRIDWSLPLMLYLLTSLKELGIYESKTDIILKRLNAIVLSVIPFCHTNRFYLLCSIDAILQQANLKDWKEHAQLLNDSIIGDKLVASFSDKNIRGVDGMPGLGLLGLLSKRLQKDKKYNVLVNKLNERIVQSSSLEIIDTKKRLQERELCIEVGISGMALSLLYNLELQKGI